MKMTRFWNYLKNNYKRIVAVTLCSLGFAFLLGSFVGNLLPQDQETNVLAYSGGFINFLILAVAYFFLFYGNVQGTYVAYRGLLMFIFFVAFDFAIYAYSYGIALFGAVGSGEPVVIGIYGAFFAVAVFAIVAGIFCYIRVTQFLQGRYAKYEMVRLWTLFFSLSVTLLDGFKIYMMATLLLRAEMSGLQIFLSLLSPLSEVLMAWACFFTVLRLKSQY